MRVDDGLDEKEMPAGKRFPAQHGLSVAYGDSTAACEAVSSHLDPNAADILGI